MSPRDALFKIACKQNWNRQSPVFLLPSNGQKEAFKCRGAMQLNYAWLKLLEVWIWEGEKLIRIKEKPTAGGELQNQMSR